MENKSALWKNSMNYGAITGFASIIYTIILYISNLMFNRALGMVSFLILIIGIYYGTKILKDNHEGGFISYGRALASGVLISFFASILGAFFNYILYVFIDPDLMEKGFQFMEEKLIEQGRLAEDQIEMFMERARSRANPLQTSLMTIPVTTLFGLILSLITSAFLKKEKQPVG